ncbi:hypothetical protein C1H46_024328 [Malus baccata]|uniref:Uncharacterized protein n=1 Tax=Malus baccata TaxID=106549 RepID=A0A540LUB2_MALBA|nr:hypothetical protein C1H46_024328 [Malus baccata]
MVERDFIAWNAFIATCVQNGHAACLREALRNGFSPTTDRLQKLNAVAGVASAF